MQSAGGKRVLALDLGRRTGWSVFVPNGPERHRDSGVFELYSDAGSPFEDGARFLALERFLFALDQACGGFDIVGFEQVNGGTKGRQTTLWNGYRAMVMAWCARTGKRVLPIPIQTVKKHISGRSNASKEEVEAAVVERGHLPFDDNEADAIATMYAAVSVFDDAAEVTRQIAIAEAMQLGEFKNTLVVERKSRTKNSATRKISLTTRAQCVTNEKDQASKQQKAVTCSSGSAESALPASLKAQNSSLPNTASAVRNSQKRSRASRKTPISSPTST
jgi:hypothetical protein